MEKKDKAKFFFGLDILLISHELESIEEKDKRNDRAGSLIRRAAVIYMNGGNQYRDMIYDVFNNALKEYQDWYYNNIYSVVMSNPVHLMEDGDACPIPKYDVNKYDLNKYFDGLNKEAFEELQKLIFFLKDPASQEALENFGKVHGSDNEKFADESRNFYVLAHSILVATLEGGEFLDRLEGIFGGYGLSDQDSKDLNEFSEKTLSNPSEANRLKDEVVKNFSIEKIAKDFLKYSRSN